MENLVTVATFTYPIELAVIRGRLESEGIPCFIKDELTVQAHNFISNAIGGIKLQVREADAGKAIEILKHAGYIKENNAQPGYWIKLDHLTNKIPLINNTRLELRLIILAAIVLAPVLLIIAIANLPNTYDSLTQRNWCVNHVVYEGKNYQPNSAGVRLTGEGFCNENIDFRPTGDIIFPGFKSYPVWGHWSLDDKILKVTQVDTFQHIYQGNYQINIDGKSMTLTSGKTIIHCYETRW